MHSKLCSNSYIKCQFENFQSKFNNICHDWLQGITILFSWKLMPSHKVGPVLFLCWFSSWWHDSVNNLLWKSMKFIKTSWWFASHQSPLVVEWVKGIGVVWLYGSWSTFFPWGRMRGSWTRRHNKIGSHACVVCSGTISILEAWSASTSFIPPINEIEWRKSVEIVFPLVNKKKHIWHQGQGAKLCKA